jgi:hypothetical protein
VLGYALIGLALGTLVPSTFLAELFPTRLGYSGLSLISTSCRPPGTPPR